MFDTLTLLAYLLGNEPGHSNQLFLQARFLKPPVLVTKMAESPQMQWRGVPPEASSLALVIKNAKQYDWVVYNLPVQTKGLSFGANTDILKADEGTNSWGQNNYHANNTYPVTVELFALDKRFSARKPMTGEMLTQKIKGHVLASVVKKFD